MTGSKLAKSPDFLLAKKNEGFGIGWGMMLTSFLLLVLGLLKSSGSTNRLIFLKVSRAV